MLDATRIDVGSRREMVLQFFGGILLALLSVTALASEDSPAPRFRVPVACNLGTDCFIQNYYDHDPGPGWRDYSCGSLSYDEHRGTDFRVRTLADMGKGVGVVAAADGIVKALRDGEPDVLVQGLGRDRVKGREAGNGVVLDHGDGWETQYSHLRKGSIRVVRGQRVMAGEALGLIGLSGNTAFPHVDFSVRHLGRAVDPFSPSGKEECGGDVQTLWHPEVLPSLRYQASGVLRQGWSAGPPDLNAIRDERPLPAPSKASQALAFWIEVFGVRNGDVEQMEIVDPAGRTIAERVVDMTRNNTVRVSLLGASRPPEGWLPGRYLARYRLLRGGAAVHADSELDLTR